VDRTGLLAWVTQYREVVVTYHDIAPRSTLL